MLVAEKSGLESLLDALRKSGMNMGDLGGSGSNPFSSAGGSSSGSSSGGGSDKGGSDGDDTLHLDLSFLDDFHGPKSKKSAVLIAIVVILVLLALYWWFHPPINVHSSTTWAIFTIIILLPVFLLLLTRSRRYQVGNAKIEKSPSKAKRFKWLSLIPVACLCVALIGAVASWPIIPGNAHRYANVLQTDTLEFAQDIQEVNYSQSPGIDRDSAVVLGNREMGTIPEYGSQVEISSLHSQINYQGTPVRVSPLGYADIFKWFTNRVDGIPAYALVDMTTQDAEIVRLGDAPIHYSQSEPLVRNIDRYVQLKYPFYMFEEKSFEIDEDGHAWWICPVKKFTIGLFGGETISRVVLVDATSGECTDLAVEDVPSWVDRVYPASLLVKQYNWYGSYNHGWLNSFLGQEGVVQTTKGSAGESGYNYIAKDDDVWVYTGVTSATADNSIIGFVLINQRTHESHFYSVSGATEDSAMASAEGKVQQYSYTATFPILINVSNQPTYFMALKDAAGLPKQFAMIDIQRYQNVAVGDTVADCQESYVQLLATNGVDVSSSGESVVLEASGTIASMTQAVVEGNSHFYVMLAGDDNIYDFALPGLIEIITYGVGDEIAFSYMEGAATETVYAFAGEDPPEVSSDAADEGDELAAGADVDVDAELTA